MKVKVYGIRNCDTVKRALAWLEAHHVEFEFHDFKKSGLEPERARAWLKKNSWEQLINRSGTTWRRMSDEAKASLTSATAALGLMCEFPTVLRRPLIEYEQELVVGYDAARYDELFNRQ